MNININAVKKQLRALAKHSGLTIREESIEQPRTDGRVIYIPRYNPAWDKDKTTMWWYYTIHEMGHNRPQANDIFPLMKEKQIDVGGTWFGGCLNVLDDQRQEHFQIGEYAFIDQTLYKGRKLFMDMQYPFAVKNKDNDKDIYRQAMEALATWDYYLREGWNGALSGGADQYYDLMTDQSKAWCDQLRAGDYGDVLLSGITALEEYALLKRIIAEVFGLNPEEEEENAKAQQGDGEGDNEGNGSGRGKENAGEVSGSERGGKTTGTNRPAHAEYEDLIMHNHSGSPSYSSLVLDYTNYKETDGYVPGKHQERTFSLDDSRNDYYYEQIDRASSSSGLSNKVRRLLQIRSKDKILYDQKQGKIHSRNLYRVGMKEAKGFNERVFKRRENNLCLDVSVSVLCDFSGSMGGDKIIHAGASCVLLSKVLESLSISHEILGFTTCRQPLNYTFKGFNQKTSRNKMLSYLAAGTENMGQNADGDSILWAYNRLIQQKTRRKILIVFSDGQPAYSNGTGSLTRFTKDVIKEIEKRKEVEIYGIGVESSAVGDYYSNYGIIEDADNLESVLFDVVKTKILA